MEVDEECAEKASILRNLLVSVKCGFCLISYATIQELHSHLIKQEQGGSYIYNHETKTAYHLNPRVSSFVQTEVMVEYEESSTQTDVTVTCADSASGSYTCTNGSPAYDIYANTFDIKYELPVSQENVYLQSDCLDRSYEIGEKLDQTTQDMDTNENTDLYYPYNRHSTEIIEYPVIKTEIDTENSYGEVQTIGLGETNKKGNHSMRLRNKKGPFVWEKEKHAQDKCRTPLRPDKRRKFKKQARQLNKTETVRKKIKMIIKKGKSLNYCTLTKVTEQDLDRDNLGTFKEKDKIYHSVRNRKRDTNNIYHIIEKSDEDQSSSVKKKHSTWPTCLACNKKVMILESHIERYHYHKYPLQCGKCFHPFKNEMVADRHNCSRSAVLYRHHCLQCPDNKSFRFRENLRTHIKNCHNNVLPLKCDKCHIKLVSKFEEREHIATHDKSTLMCCFCQQQCKSVAELDRHVVSHKGQGQEEAFNCDEKLQSRTSLQEHIIPLHGYSHTDNDNSVNNNEDIETEEDGRRCQKCGDVIPHKKMKDHLKYMCSEKIHECYICNKKFERKSGLSGHLKTHSIRRPLNVVICERCGQSFTKAVTLKSHMKYKHTFERDYKCSMCDKTFVTRSSLDRHKRVHLKILNFQCDQCEKSFSTNWNLKAHRRQHTGDTPYKCSKCGDGFAHNVVRKHHEAQCNRYYICNLKAEVETADDSTNTLA